MKDCGRCGKRKEPTDFSVNRAKEDGLNNWCKACLSAYAKDRLAKANASRPDGWKRKTEDRAAYQREWAAANPGYMTKKKKNWWQKNKDRMRVKDALRYAIKTGKVLKTPCHVCGSEKVEGHHPDYSRPLDVVWLCKEHHIEIHR
jgi:hypothetical protein